MSIEQKIIELQEKALQLAEGKDKPEDEVKGSDKDTIEKEDETKSSKKEKPMKESVELIDLGALFDGVELTEEFKTKATTIFEAAVAARVSQEVEAMEESLAQRALDESVAMKEGLVEKVDGYLDYIVEQWIKNNEIALERGIKAEIFESFVGKMRDVFVEHNINLPDEEFDLVESLQDKTEVLEKALDEQVAQNVELGRTLKSIAKQIQIDEASKGMTDIDAEKFALLADEISFDDEVSFSKKLDVIRENYVDVKVEKKVKQLTEDVTQDANNPVVLSEEVKVDPSMARYLTALNQ